MSESLKSNTTLTELYLGRDDKRKKTQMTSINNSLFPFIFTSTGNDIEDAGIKALSEALESNTTLTALDLRCEDKKRHTNYIHHQLTLLQTLCGECHWSTEFNVDVRNSHYLRMRH